MNNLRNKRMDWRPVGGVFLKVLLGKSWKSSATVPEKCWHWWMYGSLYSYKSPISMTTRNKVSKMEPSNISELWEETSSFSFSNRWKSFDGWNLLNSIVWMIPRKSASSSLIKSSSIFSSVPGLDAFSWFQPINLVNSVSNGNIWAEVGDRCLKVKRVFYRRDSQPPGSVVFLYLLPVCELSWSEQVIKKRGAWWGQMKTLRRQR